MIVMLLWVGRFKKIHCFLEFFWSHPFSKKALILLSLDSLTLAWPRSLSHRNQTIGLLCKEMRSLLVKRLQTSWNHKNILANLFFRLFYFFTQCKPNFLSCTIYIRMETVKKMFIRLFRTLCWKYDKSMNFISYFQIKVKPYLHIYILLTPYLQLIYQAPNIMEIWEVWHFFLYQSFLVKTLIELYFRELICKIKFYREVSL